MIVRKRGNYFILIKQHDHALIAGEMAAHIDEPVQPLAKTLFAISHHDIGWEELDRSVLWDEKTIVRSAFTIIRYCPNWKPIPGGFPKWLPMIIMPVFYAASIMLLFLPMRPIPPAAGSGSRNWPDKISCVNISRKLKKKISPATSGCCNFLISCRFLCASMNPGKIPSRCIKTGSSIKGSGMSGSGREKTGCVFPPTCLNSPTPLKSRTKWWIPTVAWSEARHTHSM